MTNPTAELTEKEKQTVHLIMFDYTNKEIAQELEIDMTTVSNRVCKIAYKLGIVDNRGIGKGNLKRRIREKIHLERIK